MREFFSFQKDPYLTMKTIMRIVFILLLLASFVLPMKSQSEVKMTGSTTTFLAAIKPFKDEITQATGVTITATGSTTGKGFSALQATEVDVALSASSLQSLIASATAKGIKLDASQYEEVFLKNSYLVVVANLKNPVESITEDQIQGILNGEIKVWKAVGGSDAPISVFFEKEDSANYRLITSKFLKDTAPGAKRLTYVDNVRLIVRNVAETEPGFGVTPDMYLNDQVKIISPIKIEQHLCLIIRKDASPEVRKVVAAVKAKF